MKKITSAFVSIAFLAASVGMTAASAQTTATMPILYSQTGSAVNVASNTSLSAGWYYLQSNGSSASQVYYYGNGTYYNANTGQYGGSVGDPNGTAGVSLNYTSTPGIPNTGAGGAARASGSSDAPRRARQGRSRR